VKRFLVETSGYSGIEFNPSFYKAEGQISIHSRTLSTKVALPLHLHLLLLPKVFFNGS